MAKPYVDVLTEKTDEDEEVLCVVFREGFKQAYFSRLYPLFEKALQELVEKTSLEAFCENELDLLLYSLNKINDDRFGTYISSEENGLRTINDFIRNLEPNEKYYIGGTADYHY